MKSINSADPSNPTVKPVPYTGVQFVAIPEFQGIGTDVGQDFSAALAGTMTVDDALAKAQASDRLGDEEGRLHQVSPQESRLASRFRRAAALGTFLPVPAPFPFAKGG